VFMMSDDGSELSFGKRDHVSSTSTSDVAMVVINDHTSACCFLYGQKRDVEAMQAAFVSCAFDICLTWHCRVRWSDQKGEMLSRLRIVLVMLVVDKEQNGMSSSSPDRERAAPCEASAVTLRPPRDTCHGLDAASHQAWCAVQSRLVLLVSTQDPGRPRRRHRASGGGDVCHA